MTTDFADVTDYLARYAASLQNFDAHAAAELWAVPGVIVDDRFSGVLDSREAMAQGLEQSYPLYRELGLASVGFEVQALERLTAGIVRVQVRWLFRDAEGDLLTDSTAHYVLRRETDGLRAAVCIQTDDLDKLTALADRTGVSLADEPTGHPSDQRDGSGGRVAGADFDAGHDR